MPAINSIPYDLFRTIIVYAYAQRPVPQSNHVEHDYYTLNQQLVAPPISASHVCRSWRQALLSDQSLWTYILIPQMNLDQTMEMLRRSGTALLDVFLDIKKNCSSLDNNNGSDMLLSLFQQIHRFKSLHLLIHPIGWKGDLRNLTDLVQRVLSFLERPAPNLQMFRFWYFYTLFDVERTFLSTLFSGHAPKLKHINRRLSFNYRELHSPLFRNLSELYLTLPDQFTLRFDLLLELIQLSPCLESFGIFVDHMFDNVRVTYSSPPEHRINLPYLQRLAFDASRTVELVNLLLQYLTFPPNIKWHILLRSLFEPTRPWTQLLSQARFTSLKVYFCNIEDLVWLMFEEELGDECFQLNSVIDNKFSFYEELWAVRQFWDSLMNSMDPSSITHLEIEFMPYIFSTEELWDFIRKILPKLINLEYIAVRQGRKFDYPKEQPCLLCLSALTPNPENVAALEYRSNVNTSTENTANPTQDPDLDLVPVPRDDAGSSEAIRPTISTDTPPTVFPCPFLRELLVELKDPLTQVHAVMIRSCYERRREEGYPLRILVRCPKMAKGVESILQLHGNESIDDIKVETNSSTK